MNPVMLLVFRPKTAKGGKVHEELVLVRKKESDKWTVPVAEFSAEPSWISVDFLLADFFSDVEVERESIVPVDPKHWKEAVEIFSQYRFYECRISPKARGKDWQLARTTNGRDYNQASGTLTEDTFSALSLPYVQSRLS